MMARQKFTFQVDGNVYHTEQPSMTGAAIKGMVENWVAGHALYVEGHGDAPDRELSDAEVVDLSEVGHGIFKFYSVPPANFGTN